MNREKSGRRIFFVAQALCLCGFVDLWRYGGLKFEKTAEEECMWYFFLQAIQPSRSRL